MEDNMKIYSAVRDVPDSAKREIKAGKIKGFTDINPMWRIQALTEQFGPAGFGWKTKTVRKWLEPAPDGRTAAFCDIELYVRVNGEWSDAIEGTGGSMYVNLFKGEQEATDECYKMAYTDALSVACKALGIGADVYWAQGRTKYSANTPEVITAEQVADLETRIKEMNRIRGLAEATLYSPEELLKAVYKDKAPKTLAALPAAALEGLKNIIEKDIVSMTVIGKQKADTKEAK